LNRVCEVEDTVVEWYSYTPEHESLAMHLKRDINIHQYSDQFNIYSVEVGGIDFSVWKVTLIAKKL
jgi:hypothetical protein